MEILHSDFPDANVCIEMDETKKLHMNSNGLLISSSLHSCELLLVVVVDVVAQLQLYMSFLKDQVEGRSKRGRK